MNNLPFGKTWRLIPHDPRFCKPLRIMKISTCLLFAFVTGVQANGIAQKVTLKMKNARIEEALNAISKQSNLQLFYGENIDSKARINVNLKDASVADALNAVLKSNNIEYKIIANTISVNGKTEGSRSSNIVQQGVSGTVKDKDGNALAGATVTVKGTAITTQTDESGHFKINANSNATLTIRFIGYAVREVAVSDRNNLNIVLTSDENKLEEVVISTGFQNLNPKLFTGAAVSLKGKDVIQEGTTDVSRALEGRVAGVSVQNVSGTFGAAPKMRIRGATSITGENKPLWVIDGVILEDVVNISNEQLSSGDASTLIGSSVAGLNMDDIEDINILKDASATAQYGARAMNGVVVVRTKRGRVGKLQVNYTGNFSVNLKPNYSNYNIMNSVDQMSVYAELERKGWFNYSPTSRAENGGVYTKLASLIDYDESLGDYGVKNTDEAKGAFLKRYALANTNWFDLLFKNSLQQEHSVSFNGGSEQSQLYFSTSYLKDNGWAMGNNVERFTSNLNANFKLSDKLSLNFITTGAIRNQQAPGTLGRVSNPVEGRYSRDFDINPFSYAINSSRTLTAYNEDGSLEYFRRNYAPFNIINELRNNTMDLNMLDLKFQGGLTYKILDGLSFSSLGAMRYVKTGQEHKIRENSNMAMAYRAGTSFDPLGVDSEVRKNNRFLYRDPENTAAEPETVLPYGGFYNTTDDFLKSYTFRNSLEYNKNFNEVHDLNLFVAQEIRSANRQNKSNIGYGYQFDKGGVPFVDPKAIEQAVANNLPYYSMGPTYDRQTYFLFRGAYAYDGRYAINGTFRYDGSNRMGSSATARWLPTWNISGAWNIDREKFYDNSSVKEVMNRFTIRGTYGLTASIGSATNSSLVVKSSSSLRPFPTEQENVINIINLANNDLTWEKQYEANLGFDFGFLKDKLNLTVDLYDRKGFDLIYNARTPAIGGEYKKNFNYADMRSKGLEITLGANIKPSTDFSWNSNLNFAFNKNEVTKLEGTPIIFELVGTDGGPLQGHPYRGLYSIPFGGLNPKTGVPMFHNGSGETVTYIDPQGDDISFLKYEGPTDPTFMGGFSNTFNYKGFSLFALFTFAKGNKVRLNPVFNSSYSDLDATPLEFRNRWVVPGDELDTNIPAIPDRGTFNGLNGEFPYNSYNYSDQRIAKGDLLKLKTIRLTYNISNKLMEKIKLRNASLSLVANNFWLIYADKKLNGQDPEFFGTGGVALPVSRMYTLSLKVGF